MAPGSPQRIESKEVALTSTGSWAGTIFFFLFSVGFFLLALFAIRDFVAILISGFFAVWGVVGMFMMVRASSSQTRYGPLPLELEGPATVGGRLRVSLQLPPAATRKPSSLRAVLTCSKVTYGDQQSRSEEPLQGLRKTIAVASGSSGARARFEFEIPAGLPHADDPGPGVAMRDKVYGTWELKIEALGDANLSRSYDIPVGRALPGVQPLPPDPPTAFASRKGPIEIIRTLGRPAAPPVASPLSKVEATAPKLAPAPEPVVLPEADQRSLWVLVAINLIPLAGVLFWGWRVHEVVFLYWIENLVIGAVNVLRIRIAVPENAASLAQRGVAPGDGDLFMAKAMLIGFFIVHYGAFCYGHGTFLASFFPAEPGGSRDLGGVLRSMLLNPVTLVAIIGIVLSHAYSYFHNYVGRGEYLRADLGKMMFQPYKRIVVTHVFIIVGGFALMASGSHALAMLIFIGLKILIDAYAHRQERRLAGAG